MSVLQSVWLMVVIVTCDGDSDGDIGSHGGCCGGHFGCWGFDCCDCGAGGFEGDVGAVGGCNIVGLDFSGSVDGG